MQRLGKCAEALRTSYPSVFWLPVALGLAACSGSQGEAGAAGKDTLVSVTTEPAGSQCATGGEKIVTGVDTNSNGVLDPSEVTSTRYVCNGPKGSGTLVSTGAEAPGTHCAAGGIAINTGVDTNGNGVLDPSEITSTTYVCNGAGASDAGKTAAPDAAEAGARDAAEAGMPDAAEAGMPDAAEAGAPGVDAAASACSGDAGCPSGLTCAGSYCTGMCQQTTDCPTGYYCNTPISSCLKMGCSTDSDCVDPTRPTCDQQTFNCTQAPQQVAPTIAFFRASPPAVVLGASTPITWVWDFGIAPSPAATCSIDHGVGPVTGTATIPVTAGSIVPTTYTLTCTNSVGQATAHVMVPAVPNVPASVALNPSAGGSFQLGPVSLVVPAGAVLQPITITGQLSNVFLPSPDLVALPITFSPDGFHFANPVTLTVPVDTALMTAAGWNVDLSRLHVATTSEGSWNVDVMTTVDATASTLTATIGHFSSAGASASTQGSCTSAPLSMATKTIVGRDELARLGAIGVTDGSGTGIVHDDLSQTARDAMAHITDSLGTTQSGADLFAAAGGDFDGDGRDEIAVATVYKTSAGKGGVQITVLNSCHDGDDPGGCWNDFTVMKSWTVTDNDYTDARVAVGDIDGDGLAEIVVMLTYNGAGSGEMLVYDDANHTFNLMTTVGGPNSTGTFGNFADFRVAVGDINRMERTNNIAEIAVAATCLNCGTPMVTGVQFFYGNEQDPTHGIQPFADFQTMGPTLGSDIFGRNDYSRANLVLTDVDGDGDDELVVVAPHRDDGDNIRFEAWGFNNRTSPGGSGNVHKNRRVAVLDTLRCRLGQQRLAALRGRRCERRRQVRGVGPEPDPR